MMMKHIPNTLTMMRLLLIAPFLLCLFQQFYTASFYIFLLAGFTDALDGWLARQFHWKSFFGSFVDPMADKLLIASSFISLAIMHVLPWWLVGLIFLRDLTLSIGVIVWYWWLRLKMDFQPTIVSKINTVLQLALVTTCLFELAFFKLSPYLMQTLVGLTTITTTFSYIDYVWTWGKKACAHTCAVK